eukprot:Em0001g3686a
MFVPHPPPPRPAMGPFCRTISAVLKPVEWTTTLARLQGDAEKVNESELKRLDEAIENAQKNYGESEQKDALMAKAEYLCRIGDKDSAVSAFRVAYEKTVGLGYRLDVVFYLIRIGLLLEEGGDWDRRNRLKTYHGLYAMSIRDFKMAATYFFETMATFTSTELMEYRAFVKYAVFCCMVAMDRSDLKEKVINGTDIREVLHSFPELKDYVESLYYCRYDEFFRSLFWVEREFKCDRYLATHSRYYIREMRIKAYTQLLESYRSVSLLHMAKSFGVGVEFMDRELSQFIATGRLHCRIDKVGGIIETNRPDSKNHLYQVVKSVLEFEDFSDKFLFSRCVFSTLVPSLFHIWYK